jgi:hypothetical protein
MTGSVIPAHALVAARTLGPMGYACFPCRQDKRPTTPNGFKDAATDRDAIEDLWSRYPGVLVGVATGEPSGVSVVDIDAKHDAARQWWAEHRDRLLPARVHRTRSGGLHILYRHPPGLACSTSKIARGVDVRADGGYVIWWPGAGFPVLEDRGIKPWPEWLMPLLKPAPVAPALPISRRALAARGRAPRPMLGILRTIAQAPEGQRNKLAFWGGCRLAEMVAAGTLTDSDAIALVVEASGRAGIPPIEATRTARSALRCSTPPSL